REKDGVQMKWNMLNSVTNNTWMQIGQIFVQNWQSIGVDVTNVGVQYPQLVTAWQKREFDMAMVQPPHEMQADPDPSDAYHSRNAVKGIGQNYTGYKNPQVDQLLDQAVATLDRSKRQELYFKMQDLVNE